MSKGGGTKKGKQPAPKAAQKWRNTSPEEDAAFGVFLAQIAALERAHGLPLGGGLGGAPRKRGRTTPSTPSVHAQIHQCLLAVAEKAAGAMVPAGGVDPRPPGVAGGALVQASIQPHPSGGSASSGEYLSTSHLGSWP